MKTLHTTLTLGCAAVLAALVATPAMAMPQAMMAGANGHVGNGPMTSHTAGANGHVGNGPMTSHTAGANGHVGNGPMTSHTAGANGHVGNSPMTSHSIGLNALDHPQIPDHMGRPGG